MSETAATVTPDASVPRACTGVSDRLDEPLLGTAPHAVAWLLVVHPGPWPQDAPGALFDPVVADELERRCARERVRLVAVRRSTSRPGAPARVCYVASSRAGRTWIERLALAEPKDLLDLDLAAIADGTPPEGGERVAGPLYAVCTHGKRDACCASYGRPVHRAVSRLAPGRTWEATHLGGHRFAANVLVLPEGLLYGRVDRDNAATLVRGHEQGTVDPALWRGRSAEPQPAQAAEWFARRATGTTAIDGVTIDDVRATGHGWTVRLRAAGAPLTATVERVATGCTRTTACTGTAADPGRWRLIALA